MGTEDDGLGGWRTGGGKDTSTYLGILLMTMTIAGAGRRAVSQMRFVCVWCSVGGGLSDTHTEGMDGCNV